MSELFKTAVVEKRNVLNELRDSNMTLQELRFFSIYLSKINPQDISTRCVRFPIEDFQRIMGLGKLNIGQLKASTNNLLRKVVNIPEESGGYTAFTLFKKCRVFRNDDEWFIEINASDDALPLMFDFKNRYFTYELWNALRLKSSNQIRMYEILKQYEGVGKRELSVEELRELLGIDKDDYTDRTGWSNFKKKVLDNCQEALKQYTDIYYTYERGKAGKGGKWLSVIFYIHQNNDYTEPLSLEKFISMQKAPEQIDCCLEDDSELLEEDAISGQTTFFDIKSEENELDFEDDNLSFLATACNAEFSEKEMHHILTLLINKEFPEHYMGIWFARHDYLHEMYSKLDVYADKQNITDRFAYLCKMLENDDRY